jgi:Glycosyl transferases group 1.
VLVGDGANRIALEALAKELAVVEQVIFTGFIPYTMIPEYMRTFDVVVDLSLVSMKSRR